MVLSIAQLAEHACFVQNAAPDGPAVFMFAEIISRPLRWADDEWETASKHKLRKQCLYADQDAYADVLPDVASGYMLFPKALWCVDEVCGRWCWTCQVC